MRYVNKEDLREEFDQMWLYAWKDHDESAIRVMNSVIDVLDKFRSIGVEKKDNNEGNAWRKITTKRPPKICTHVVILRRDGRYEIAEYKPVQCSEDYKLFAWSDEAKEYCTPIQDSEVRLWRKIPNLPKWFNDMNEKGISGKEGLLHD